MDIEDICKKAKAENLSYGKYVYKHADELKGKIPAKKIADNECVCKKCGRAFVPVSNRNVFCQTKCRVSWNQKKRREKNKQNKD